MIYVTIIRRTVQVLVLLSIFALAFMGEYQNLLAQDQSYAQVLKQGIDPHPIYGTIHNWRNREQRMEPLPVEGDLLWSFSVNGYNISDPLGILGTTVATRKLKPDVLAHALVLTLLAVLLGRVFCGWLCPVGFLLEMAQRLRRLLNKLGIVTLDVQFPRWTKYVVLALFVGFASMGVYLSKWLYGPLVVASEANNIAVEGVFKIGVLLMLGVFLFEVLISERWLCRYVCPGGALYSLLSWLRIVRVQYAATGCVSCNKCKPVCTMGLAPQIGKLGPECDSCGSCIASCPTAALQYGFAFPRLRWTKPAAVTATCLAILLLLCGSAGAHHIQGVSSDYFKNYPNTPEVRLTADAGPYKVTMTYWDYNPNDKSDSGDESNERIMKIYIHVLNPKDKKPYRGRLRLTVTGEHLDDSEPDTRAGPDETSIYAFKFLYRQQEPFNAKIELLDAGDAEATIGFSLKEEGISKTIIMISACGVLVVLLIQVFAYVKKRSSRPVTDS